jgi:hypothetical protein
MNSEINDKRDMKEFKKISFSGFKRTDVTKELLKSFLNSKIEHACYWSSELICSGHYIDLWHVIILFVSKYIHLGNPKLIPYIDLRVNNFKDILKNGYVGSEIKMRNNPKIRKLFAEIIVLIVQSNRKHGFETIKLEKNESFDITLMGEKFKAPNTNFAQVAFKTDDPKEIFVAINELSYHLSSKSLNNIQSCYWIEWIIEYEVQCKKNKKKCLCERRDKIPVDSKEQMHIIWIIWDILFFYSGKKNDFIKRIMNNLLNLFCLRFTYGMIKKRKFILYYAVSLITEQVHTNIELLKDKTVLEKITGQIDNIYKQIKKNEQAPNTDYLFNNQIAKSNVDKTIEKLDIMNNIFEI